MRNSGLRKHGKVIFGLYQEAGYWTTAGMLLMVIISWAIIWPAWMLKDE